MINIDKIENELNSYVMESRDLGKIKKMMDSLKVGKLNKDNFYDVIRKFTRNVYSDHGISRWQILSDKLYDMLEEN